MLFRTLFLSTLLIPVLARPKTKEDEKTPLSIAVKCPESRLSYFMTVRVEPLSSSLYKADDVDESKCREWCTTNQTPVTKSINCSSYSYNDETRRCKLYAEQTYPDGALERRVTSKPKRFFEKYCMPEKLSKCAKTDFMRVDEMLLSGFAQSTAMFRTLPECMDHCIEEESFNCKSAMYFYEEGECILNLDTISSNNTLIHVEDDDRVVFLQNDCFMKMEEKKEKLKPSKEITTEKPITTTSEHTTSEHTTSQPTTEPSTESSTTKITESTTQSQPSTIKTTKLVEPSFSDEGEVNVDGKEEMAEKKQEIENKEPSMRERPIAKRPDMQEDILKKKTEIIKTAELGFMHSAENNQEVEKKDEESKPQLYGAKILEPDTTGIVEPTEEVLSQKELDIPKPSKQAAPESTKVVKTNNVLNEFQLASAPAPKIEPEENRYFSIWSIWTPCSNIGERRIRRRKCLDFKKCKGRLMEIDYCPAELVLREEEPIEEQPDNDAFARGPIGPVRQPLPVANVETEAGSPPSILPPQLPKKPIEVLPEGAPGNADDVWSPWLGVCQHFVSTQPCKNNQAIGFESRECIAKDPKNCHGPFFRYCTLPCE